jgi:hypothetical protein
MKNGLMPFACLLLASVIFILCTGFQENKQEAGLLNGAWQRQTGNQVAVLLFADGYSSYTVYNKNDKQFIQTSGGPFTLKGNQLSVLVEFNTANKHEVGNTVVYSAEISRDQLTISGEENKTVWTRLDDGAQNLAGTWKITARKQGDIISPIHQTGTRKTLKILTGTRFQWVAINPGTKEFSGTGGGHYSFTNGTYTEHIEFFSRDSTRVGASLSFNGKIEQDGWHHSGKSSKGDDIYEVWGRINK